MPTLSELYAAWCHLLLCEAVRETIRRVEEKLPEDDPLFDEVLTLRLTVDRGIEAIKRTHSHDAHARARVLA